MNSIYFEKDDILEIRMSDKPILREVSQGLQAGTLETLLNLVAHASCLVKLFLIVDSSTLFKHGDYKFK